MSRILALETSTPAAGVALLDGDSLVSACVIDGPRASAALLPEAARLLAEAGWRPGELDAVAASLGPGSFTGLRVGLALAKSLAWSAGIALVGESSLRTLAASWRRAPGAAGPIAPVLDARRGQVYGALFAPGDLARLEDEIVADPEAWGRRLADLSPAPVVLGDAWAAYPALQALVPSPPPDAPDRPSAEALARLGAERLAAGHVLDPRTALPNYVRGHGAIPPRDLLTGCVRPPG